MAFEYLKIGQGSTFGGKRFPDNKKRKLLILECGFNRGLNFIDTGEYYEGGIAEEIVGEFIRNKRDRVIVSTKFKAANNSYDDVIKSCESSLKRLNTEYIDLYQVQWPNPEIPIEETMSALFALQRDGKIIDIGVCNFTFDQFRGVSNQAVSLQTEFNLQNREALIMVPYSQVHNRKIIGYNIFNQGFLNLPLDHITHSIARKYEKTIYQVILAWAISKGIFVLTNTMNPVHLRDNIDAMQIVLGQEDIDLIDSSYLPPILIEPQRVHIKQQKIDKSHKVYCTLEEVIENAENIHPNPFIMADYTREHGLLKPIEVKQNDTGYELIHGSARYWWWVLAFKDKPIPAFVIY